MREIDGDQKEIVLTSEGGFMEAEGERKLQRHFMELEGDMGRLPGDFREITGRLQIGKAVGNKERYCSEAEGILQGVEGVITGGAPSRIGDSREITRRSHGDHREITGDHRRSQGDHLEILGRSQ